MTFRLLTYNILNGGVGRTDAIATVINACAPDLVLLQEATVPSTVERLAEATGMADWRTFKRQSLGFMSRRPVAFCQWIRPRISRHAFIEIVPEGERLIVFGVHLSAVLAAWTEQRRTLEFRALMRSVAYHEDRFHVLAGDFNTIAPTDTLEIKTLPLLPATADLVERRPRALARHPDRARRRLRRHVPDAAPGRSWLHAPDQESPGPARLRVRAAAARVTRARVRRGQASGRGRRLRSLSRGGRSADSGLTPSSASPSRSAARQVPVEECTGNNT